MYNAILIKYKNSYQLRTYEFPIDDSVDTSESSESNTLIPDDSFDYKTVADSDRSLSVSLNRSKQSIFSYARSNDWSNGYFVTLTINPDIADSFSYKDSVTLLHKFRKNLLRLCPSAYGLFVPELHPTSGRFHFHGLINGCDLLKLGIIKDSGHTFNGEKIYNFCKCWKYGFSNISIVQNTLAVEKYITKYTTKELLSSVKNQHRYFQFNCSLADSQKFNIPCPEYLLKELYRLNPDLVLHTSSVGTYNPTTFIELKKSKLILDILKDIV